MSKCAIGAYKLLFYWTMIRQTLEWELIKHSMAYSINIIYILFVSVIQIHPAVSQDQHGKQYLWNSSLQANSSEKTFWPSLTLYSFFKPLCIAEKRVVKSSYNSLNGLLKIQPLVSNFVRLTIVFKSIWNIFSIKGYAISHVNFSQKMFSVENQTII